MRILGINSFFEHPSIALINDGKLEFAVEDERFTRVKHGKSYTPYKTYIPYDSVHASLEYLDLNLSDIDIIAYSYDKWLHLRSTWGCFTGHRLSSFSEEWAAFRSVAQIRAAMSQGYEIPERYRKRMPPAAFNKIKFQEWDHHVSHAASAFFCSGYDSSLILVADGSGEKAATSIYQGRGRSIRKLSEISLPHSLGFFYSFFTQYLGFQPYSDEYKVMGLAAYGEPKFGNELSSILSLSPRGKYKLDLKAVKNLSSIFGPARAYDEPLNQVHKDLACSVQKHLEKVLKHITEYYIEVTGLRNICLAGGTFQNILANSQLANFVDSENIFVQPASHDAGTAIGAAAMTWAQYSASPQLQYTSMFLGTEYSNDYILKALNQADAKFEKMETEQQTISKVAELLSQEKVIGLFRGRMEFGPRALGNRSILASPKSKITRDKLNELKSREQFRPLAPIVPNEVFSEYFDGISSRYMLFTVDVKENKKIEIPAVVHADGTARAQVIYKQHDSFLHSLLMKFGDLSGVPVLINTSLNTRGKPIDESPEDALCSFFLSGLDYLLLGDYLVRKT